MKRYLLFAGGIYYPTGGWDDYKATADSLEELYIKGAEYKAEYKWFHVVDTQTMEIVYKYN